VEAERLKTTGPERAAMLVATVGGPFVPLAQLGAYYVAVPVACNRGDVIWPLHLITVAALVAVAAAIAVSWRGLRRAGRSGGGRGANGSRWFVYAMGLALCGLAAVAVVLMGTVNLFFDPCEGDHEFRLPRR
jgi:hypothetical protein